MLANLYNAYLNYPTSNEINVLSIKLNRMLPYLVNIVCSSHKGFSKLLKTQNTGLLSKWPRAEQRKQMGTGVWKITANFVTWKEKKKNTAQHIKMP